MVNSEPSRLNSELGTYEVPSFPGFRVLLLIRNQPKLFNNNRFRVSEFFRATRVRARENSEPDDLGSRRLFFGTKAMTTLRSL